jgi:hypothetical protein
MADDGSTWAIVELMGHRERPGRVTEVEMYGGKLLRIDIPAPAGDVTEFYGVSAIYSVRPVSEEIARDRATRIDSRPVRPVEYRSPNTLPAPKWTPDEDFDPCEDDRS